VHGVKFIFFTQGVIGPENRSSAIQRSLFKQCR